MFCAVLTSRVIFKAKISLDLFSLVLKQVLTCSAFGDRIYEYELIRVTESGRQGFNTARSFCCTSTIDKSGTNQESNPQNLSVNAPPPYCGLLQSVGATEGLFFPRGRSPSPDPHRINTCVKITFRSICTYKNAKVFNCAHCLRYT